MQCRVVVLVDDGRGAFLAPWTMPPLVALVVLSEVGSRRQAHHHAILATKHAVRGRYQYYNSRLAFTQ